MISLDAKGAAFIADEESYGGGRISWPGGVSGPTLPYGYDLGQVTAEQFEKDCRDLLDWPVYNRLQKLVGSRGANANLMCRSSSIASIVIPKGTSIALFQSVTLPRYCALASKTYPGIENLPAGIQTALVSLCVNRGGIPLMLGFDGAESTDVDRYVEERAIRADVQDGGWEDIPVQLRLMAVRLWPGDESPNPGLRKRRNDEALLCEQALKIAA